MAVHENETKTGVISLSLTSFTRVNDPTQINISFDFYFLILFLYIFFSFHFPSNFLGIKHNINFFELLHVLIDKFSRLIITSQ